jgi:hypothetical protein
MTSPESPSSSHPARAAGFALLGVALIALVIGVATLFTGGDSGTNNAEGTSTPPGPSTPASTPGPASSTEAPAGSTAPPAATTTTTPPATSTPPPAAGTTTPPPPVTPAAKPPVRIYNNSTIAGLAARASDDVKRSGWEVAETGNYSQGQIPTTTVYFRPGTEEEASAKQLASVMQARVEERFDGIQTAHAGIIVIVTNDYKGAQNVK